jgi:segregation and condensation protein A
MPSALPSDAQGNATYRVTLPEFEGPLDLLLHLCQTHELDILNISIAFIAEKYIEYLEVMQNMSVEVAADYLVMAAHLAYLKSRELVPSPEPLEPSEDGEDPIDPREELIRRLLQYQKYKHAAENLSNRPIEGRNVFVRGVVLEPGGEAGLAEHSVWKLLEHWAQVLEKAKPQYTHDVVIDRMSITDRINQIVDLLETGEGMVRFEDLLGKDLPEVELRHKVVVSLLAVLELARLRVVRILQQVDTGSFFLAQAEGANLADARNLNVTSAKEEDAPRAKASAQSIEARNPTETSSMEGQAQELADEASADEAPDAEAATAAETIAEAIALTAAEASLAEAEAAEAEAAEAVASTTAEASLAETVAEASLAETVAEEATTVAASAVEVVAPAPIVASAAEDASTAEGAASQWKSESVTAASDTAQLVPQEDVVSAPFPAPPEEGEEVIDGQTQEEQEVHPE